MHCWRLRPRCSRVRPLAQTPPRRDVRFEWDPNRRQLFLDVSFRDAIDSEILRKLTRGLPMTIVFTATLYRAGTRNALSTTAQTCKITWLVWDEAYLIEITRPPGGSRTDQTITPGGVLRRCLDATGLFVADSKQIPNALVQPPRDVALYLEAKVQVNPVSAELLQRIKRWVVETLWNGHRRSGRRAVQHFHRAFLAAHRQRRARAQLHHQERRAHRAPPKETMTSRVFPIALVLEGRPCLVIGSNAEAAHRAEALFQAGAMVTVLAEQPEADLLRLELGGRCTLERRAFVPSDLDDKWLAVLTDRRSRARPARVASRRRATRAFLGRRPTPGQ